MPILKDAHGHFWHQGTVVSRHDSAGIIRRDVDGLLFGFASGNLCRDMTYPSRTQVGCIVYFTIARRPKFTYDVGDVGGVSWQAPDPTPFKERWDKMIDGQVQSLSNAVDKQVLADYVNEQEMKRFR